MTVRPDGRIVEEQAALRRVATAVARGGAPEETFDLVAAEVAHLFDADMVKVFRFEGQRNACVVGWWSTPGLVFPGGNRLSVVGGGPAATVLQTGRPAPPAPFAGPAGSIDGCFARLGARSGVGAPITVEGRLWGAVVAATIRSEGLPAGSEQSLAAFTELAATAIGNAQARVELHAAAEEQAALRRVATLVARGAAPEEVFVAVTEEVRRVLGADFATMGRFEVGEMVTSVGPTAEGDDRRSAVRLGGRNVTSQVFETGRPARLDDYADASGEAGETARGWGVRSSVGVPVIVDGHLWGVVVVSAMNGASLPVDTEVRLARFTELIATAVGNAQARVERRGFAEEQAALRRVATLVARAAPPQAVFAAVTAEVGGLLGCDFTLMNRYDTDDSVTVVGAWARAGNPTPLPVGVRVSFDGRNATSQVFRTGRPARIDRYARDAGTDAAGFLAAGIRTSVGAPITVEGRLWGVMLALTRDETLPPDTEARLAAFTELVATTIANAEAQAQLTASRARIVATADATRRRIERDLHDGIQQGLVSLLLQATAAAELSNDQADQMRAELLELRQGLVAALDELRETARGIHPSILTEAGLGAALSWLAARCPVPVALDFQAAGRLPEPIEVAAYYVVAEAMTNAVKHADASLIDVAVTTGGDALCVCVRDDGRGGAHASGGSGLMGLVDRVEALGGRLTLHSRPGAGTALEAVLPLTGPTEPGRSRPTPALP